ncbi:unnamed protein product [Urochloa humidicola]
MSSDADHGTVQPEKLRGAAGTGAQHAAAAQPRCVPVVHGVLALAIVTGSGGGAVASAGGKSGQRRSWGASCRRCAACWRGRGPRGKSGTSGNTAASLVLPSAEPAAAFALSSPCTPTRSSVDGAPASAGPCPSLAARFNHAQPVAPCARPDCFSPSLLGAVGGPCSLLLPRRRRPMPAAAKRVGAATLVAPVGSCTPGGSRRRRRHSRSRDGGRGERRTEEASVSNGTGRGDETDQL